MAHDAQIWQDLLCASGGGLELTKSSFHVLHFQFLPNGAPTVSLDIIDDCIHLRDSATNHIIPIKVHKTLGHWKAPANPKQRAQLSAIKTTAKKQSILISTSPIT